MTTDQVAYRESHAAEGYGRRYDKNYLRGYYAAIYREVESPLLDDLFKEFGGNDRQLLDFACGTGRITRLAIPHFGKVVGVDVSDAMLEQARSAVNAAILINQDLTVTPLDERFNVITSFRFFLNAEQELRIEALKAIHAHLTNDGVLICNIHMNRHSIMGAVYAVLRILTGRVKHKTLSLEEFESTLCQTGFKVDRVIWYGLTPRPGRLLGPVMDRIVGPLERTFLRLGVTGRFAHSFVVIARPLCSPKQRE